MLSRDSKDSHKLETFDLDVFKLDKIVRTLFFIASHIRQVGDVDLSAKIDSAAYNLLDVAYNNKGVYLNVCDYATALLSIAVEKEFISQNGLSIFKEAVRTVFVKRQTNNIFEIEELDTVKDIKELHQATSIKIFEDKHQTQIPQIKYKENVFELSAAKKDKIEINTNLKKIDDKRQSERRQEILRALSSTPVSIKDIAVNVAGCSEKTIQRELNSLVDEGRVKRVGEKRWSKYAVK